MQTANRQPDQLAAGMPTQPAVSIVLPFEPHLRSKAELENQFQGCVNKVIAQLDDQYDNEPGRLVISKLKKIFSRLNFSSFKKSVAIFVSPVIEKIIYMPFSVTTVATVAPAFSMQRVIKAKTENRSFLLVNLSRYTSNIYVSNGQTMNRISMNTRDGHEGCFVFPKGNAFTDRNELRNTLLHSFLQRTDQALQLLLKAYPLPVVITGSPKVMGEFRKISSGTNIVKYINGFFANADQTVLRELMRSVLNGWEQLQQKHLLQRLDAATGAGHLAVGIRDVWRQANARNASLLVVEENYIPAAILQPPKAETAAGNFSPWRNTVDDIMEKVLEAGGDVELVKPGALAGFEPIVLIERYSSLL